jgi:hypothetical protein
MLSELVMVVGAKALTPLPALVDVQLLGQLHGKCTLETWGHVVAQCHPQRQPAGAHAVADQIDATPACATVAVGYHMLAFTMCAVAAVGGAQQAVVLVSD